MRLAGLGRTCSIAVNSKKLTTKPAVGHSRPSGGVYKIQRSLIGRCSALRPNETPEEALERRRRESERVEERVTFVNSVPELEARLEKAKNRLVVIEIESESVCQTGWEEEAELQWKDDQRKALEPCQQLKHTFQRTARDCPDVEFLMVEAESENGETSAITSGWMCFHLFNSGEKERNCNNEKASTYITDLESRAELDEFVSAGEDDKMLVVIDVSLSDASPCVHIFPAVMALAKNFTGMAKFARVMGDSTDDFKQFMADENITQVPTFLFYRGGKMIGRHVGSSRGDLIGQILKMQNAAGIPPPMPQGGRQRQRRARA
eukprot:jgi/Picre1/27442/NNA_000409.t1